MEEDEKKKGPSIGIVIGTGAKGNRFTNVKIDEIDRALINDGENNEFTNLHISQKPKPEEPKANAASSSHHDWHKRPIGALGLTIVGALLSAAALWAVTHYFD